MFIQLECNGSAVEAGDTLSLGASLTGNQTIISKNGTFELGFFTPNGSNWYIGIWYAQIPEKTYVWVANRETPARNRTGVLKLSREGKLVLFNAEGVSIWSVNTTNNASRAVILDSGNFLLLNNDNKSGTVWQSFDNPADTCLPGMVFGGQQKLVSWKSSSDPAPGLFSLQVDPSGAKQLVLTWNNSVQYWASGIWDGKIYSGVPEIADKRLANMTVVSNSSGLFQSYTLIPSFKALVRFVVTKFGQVQVYVFDGGKYWSMIWSVPRDGCAVHGTCGAYGICYSNNLQFCSCGEGFKPVDDRAWVSQDWVSSGCVRQTPLNCSTDGFIDIGVTLPNDFASSYPASSKKDCRKACLRNCSCTAFSFSQPSGPCQIWCGDLLNMRNSAPSKSNSNVFIRVGPSQLSPKRKTTIPVGVVLGIVGALTLALGISSILIWRRYQQRSMDTRADSSDSFLRLFSYKELKVATRNFRSILGSGGFGSVFKGCLSDGRDVAVKKMVASTQDEKQFRAEISSLGNIQHVNLVRLQGFCAEGSRRLLVYDYMPNGSLSSLLFTSDSKSTREGRIVNIVEEGVAEEADMEEVRRACAVALLCIQENEEVRPSMRQVVQMLEGKMEPQILHIPSSALRPAHRSDTSSYSDGNGTN
ncbi:hypothetical protein SUGI_0258050 [Cryptomeria japonica]|nr:hypothetical protein SUGI_0258050 [Cryptomeria japonica]